MTKWLRERQRQSWNIKHNWDVMKNRLHVNFSLQLNSDCAQYLKWVQKKQTFPSFHWNKCYVSGSGFRFEVFPADMEDPVFQSSHREFTSTRTSASMHRAQTGWETRTYNRTTGIKPVLSLKGFNYKSNLNSRFNLNHKSPSNLSVSQQSSSFIT